MGLRGELFSTKAVVSNRSYFFNVKENRLGDLFMTLVESKPNEGEGFDRHQVVVFADDLREFLKSFDESLRFMEREAGKRRREKSGARPFADRKASEGEPFRRDSATREDRRDGDRDRAEDARGKSRPPSGDGKGARAKFMKRKDGKPFDKRPSTGGAYKNERHSGAGKDGDRGAGSRKVGARSEAGGFKGKNFRDKPKAARQDGARKDGARKDGARKDGARPAAKKVARVRAVQREED